MPPSAGGEPPGKRKWIKVKGAGDDPFQTFEDHETVADFLEFAHRRIKVLKPVDFDDLKLYTAEPPQKRQLCRRGQKLAEIEGGDTSEKPWYLDCEASCEVPGPSHVPARVDWFEALYHSSEKGQWLGEEGAFHQAPILVRECYKKMAEKVFDLQSLEDRPKLTHIVKGTPGIGKSTMAYYLLWRCLQDQSPFTDVLFASSREVFVARKKGGTWHQEAYTDGQKVGRREGKALGLVDVNAAGEVRASGTFLEFNIQPPCLRYGLHRLVVVASAGADLGQLIDKTGDGPMPEEWFLPVWHAAKTREWAARALPGKELDDECTKVCGLAVPRLVEIWAQGKFEPVWERFRNRIAGLSNAAGMQGLAKDAQTMLLLQASEDLREDARDVETGEKADEDASQIAPMFVGGGKQGALMGFASARVERGIWELLPSSDAFKHVIENIPDVTPYVLAWMVLNKLVGEGLQLDGDGSKHMKFKCEVDLWTLKTVKDGVLYRTRGNNYPAIDACGVPEAGSEEFAKKLVLIQVTKTTERERIQRHLVEQIHVPKRCKAVLCLYIVPTAPLGLTLTHGNNPLAVGEHKGQKVIEELICSASSLLAKLPPHVQQSFEPGRKV